MTRADEGLKIGGGEWAQVTIFSKLRRDIVKDKVQMLKSRAVVLRKERQRKHVRTVHTKMPTEVDAFQNIHELLQHAGVTQERLPRMPVERSDNTK